MSYAIHHDVLVNALVELSDVDLIGVSRSFRISLNVIHYALVQVVHAPSLDARGGRVDPSIL